MTRSERVADFLNNGEAVQPEALPEWLRADVARCHMKAVAGSREAHVVSRNRDGSVYLVGWRLVVRTSQGLRLVSFGVPRHHWPKHLLP